MTDDEYDQLLVQAQKRNWAIQTGERRTFLSTPMRLRLELQRRTDVIETGEEAIAEMTIAVPDLTHTPAVDQLLDGLTQPIHWKKGERLSLLEVKMIDSHGMNTTDQTVFTSVNKDKSSEIRCLFMIVYGLESKSMSHDLENVSLHLKDTFPSPFPSMLIS